MRFSLSYTQQHISQQCFFILPFKHRTIELATTPTNMLPLNNVNYSFTLLHYLTGDTKSKSPATTTPNRVEQNTVRHFAHQYYQPCSNVPKK